MFKNFFKFSDDKKKKKVKILIFTLSFIIVFIIGLALGSSAIKDRLAPIVIDWARDHIFGVKFVLNAEKIYFNFKDKAAQLTHGKNNSGDSTGDAISLNQSTIDFFENYYTSKETFSNFDLSELELFVKNTPKNIEDLLYYPPLEDEGKWKLFEVSPETYKPAYATTFIRSDEDREYVMVNLFRFDLDEYKLEHVAGHSDTELNWITGRMTQEQKESVVWAFSGGYQYIHGSYGMKYKNKVVLKPKRGAATLMMYDDGSYEILEWTNNVSHDNCSSFRQNELQLIIDGDITPKINRMWGLTPKNIDPIYTVRSGMGFTANNELVFAFGDHLSAKTLAVALKKAGVIDGMHLDMNVTNVHLVNFARDEKGNLKSKNAHQDLSYYNNIYTKGHKRDYFILTKK